MVRVMPQNNDIIVYFFYFPSQNVCNYPDPTLICWNNVQRFTTGNSERTVALAIQAWLIVIKRLAMLLALAIKAFRVRLEVSIAEELAAN